MDGTVETDWVPRVGQEAPPKRGPVGAALGTMGSNGRLGTGTEWVGMEMNLFVE
jgi:hypothetical protein